MFVLTSVFCSWPEVFCSVLQCSPYKKPKLHMSHEGFLLRLFTVNIHLHSRNCPSKVLFWLYSLIAEGYAIKLAYIINCAPPPCLVSFHDFLGLLLLIVELYWQTLNWIHFIPKTGILVIGVVFAAEMLCCWFCFIWFL